MRNLGLLWAYSRFPFEGMNGWLGDLYHGTREPKSRFVVFILQHIHLDSCCAYHDRLSKRQRLGAASEQIIRNGEHENVKQFLSNMFSRGQRYEQYTSIYGYRSL